MKLNEEQKLAVNHLTGPCLVTAVPGSGKTRTLTARVVSLVKSGVSPARILCLTFTNKAANEMKSRIAKHLGQESNKLWVSTFHSLCVAILRKFGSSIKLLPTFSIYDEQDQRELINKIARMNEYDAPRNAIFDMMKAVNDFREDITDFEDHITSLSPIQIGVIREYMKTLDEFNAVDFSGLLQKTYLLLRKHQEVADKLSNKFQYVLEDEGQDTNRIQYEIVKAIGRHGNVFVVADKDQSIFSWRGAKPENLDLLEGDFGTVRRITLPRNYRSTNQILSVAQRLIHHNKSSECVRLISDRGAGEDVMTLSFETPTKESEFIAGQILDLKDRYNCKWNDFAILYRANSLSRIPETILRQFEIPYKIFGGFSFYDRKEIKTIFSYLSFLANPNDTIAFERAISYPKRGIGPTAIGRLEKLCKDQKINMIEACHQVDSLQGFSASSKENLGDFVRLMEDYQKQERDGKSIGDIASGVIHESGYHEHMVKEAERDPKDKCRVDNINELMVSISEYQSQKPDARMSDYLQTVQLITTSDDTAEDSVHLMTMHSAKGLEYKVVFVIGVEEGMIPHFRSVQEGSTEEERRLFYVALTRAKDCLYITRARTRMRVNRRSGGTYPQRIEPSEFLNEIGVFDG